MRCPICHLPTLPWGGEDTCMGHEDPDHERELIRADQQIEDDEALALADTEPPPADAP